MSRNLSATARAAIHAQETAEDFIALLTITHADLPEPIYVTSAGQDVTSNSVTFTALPFDVVLPDEAPDRPPRAKLRVDNVSQQMGATVRSIGTAPSMSVDIVTSSNLDDPELTYPDFTLSNITIDRMYIEGDLTMEEFTNEPFGQTFTKSLYPALY